MVFAKAIRFLVSQLTQHFVLLPRVGALSNEDGNANYDSSEK